MENTDLCICGHELQDHHRSWFPGGGQLIEECEYFGSNLHGGAEYIESEDRWIDHCQRFKLAGGQ